ncbi:MAG: HAD family phosphatase [Coriobacteriia bacterium]|nr:HAD family phosphatase [Coriobacteriia bacterium]
MDGVLFDTEVLARHLWQEIFSEYGYTLPDETYKKVIGRTMEAARHILVEEYGPDLPMDAMFDEQDVRYRAALAQHVPQKPCVNEILDYLQLINMPCALGSSTHYADVITHLQVNGLRDYFTAVVGGDCVAQGKPAPDIFLECAKQLAVAPAHCLVIEDSNNGLRAANAAGMQAIMVPDLLAPKDTDSDLNFTVCASLCEVMDLLAAHAAHD